MFARDVQVVALSSGSKGNCTYVTDGHAGVLIDCGLSTKQILLRMEKSGLGDGPIDAVLLTHEHWDHVASAAILERRLRKRNGCSVPFFCTQGTADNLKPQACPEGLEIIRSGEPFRVRHFEVDPFTVPHDTVDPVGYRVGISGTWAGVLTDLGQSTTLVAHKLSTLSIALLEFNHDTEMLLGGEYPWELKQRIKSNTGHLSNDQAAKLLQLGLSDRLEHLLLGHLSEDNNRPDIALASALGVFAEMGAVGQVPIQVTRQREALPPVSTRVRDW